MFFVNGMSCWERSLFPNRSFPWQTCFLVKVGKRLALCTWLCGSSYSTAINASPKTSAQQTKKVSPIQNTRTIKRKVKKNIWNMKSDTRWKEMISILTRYNKRCLSRDVWTNGEAVKSCNSTRTCFSAPQLWGCAKVHGCLPLVPWQKASNLWKFRENLKKAKNLVFLYKKRDVFDFDIFFCAKDLDNCEFDFSNCSNVQSGESCEIKCNPPYVLAAAWQNRYPSARNVLSLEMDWSAGQLLAPSCRAFSVGRI